MEFREIDGEAALTDSAGTQIDIKPTWESSIPPSTARHMNTDPVEIRTAECQTSQKENVCVQTDDVALSRIDWSRQAGPIESFLKRVEPRMMAALEDGDRVDLGQTVEEEVTTKGPEGSTKLLHELCAFGDGLPNTHKLVCTAIGWNTTGLTIAVAYGRNDLDGWCSSPGLLATWNLGREVVKGTPDVRIDVDCCLTACAFHPRKPAIIAGGTFNGELYIWDIGTEGDCQKGRSGINDVSHQDAIVEIVWQHSVQEEGRYGNKDQAYRVVTLGADGRVLIWLWHKAQSPVYGYELTAAIPGGHRLALCGGSAMAMLKDAQTFVVGTISGCVFRCLFDFNEALCKRFAEVATGTDGGEIHWQSPIKETDFELHAGPIHGMDCSPFQRDLFLSCGADGRIQMYSTLSGRAVLALEPSNCYLFSVEWSHSRPLVFAAGAGDGRVFFYDLMKSTFHPCEALAVSDLNAPVYALKFNRTMERWFATASGDGAKGVDCMPDELILVCVFPEKVWQLAERLTRQRRIETDLIQVIGEAAAKGQTTSNVFRQLQEGK